MKHRINLTRVDFMVHKVSDLQENISELIEVYEWRDKCSRN